MKNVLLRIAVALLIGLLSGWLMRKLLPLPIGIALLFVGFLWALWKFVQTYRSMIQRQREARKDYESRAAPQDPTCNTCGRKLERYFVKGGIWSREKQAFIKTDNWPQFACPICDVQEEKPCP